MSVKYAALCFALTCSAVFAGNNGPVGPMGIDPPLVVNGGWQIFSWGAGINPFDLEGPFTFTSASPVVLKVTDAFCKGDQFRVYDNGVQIFDTTAVPVGTCPGPADTGDPNTAFNDPTYSHGSILLL